MPGNLSKLLIGAKVQTTKPIEWHELRIPKGTPGVITSIDKSGKAAMVKFDDGRKYGSFECWVHELKLAR